MGAADAIVLAATMLAVAAFLYQLYSSALDPAQRKGFLERKVIGSVTLPPLALLGSYLLAVLGSYYSSKFVWNLFTFVAMMIGIASPAQGQLAKRNREGYTSATFNLLFVIILILTSVLFHAAPFDLGSNLKSPSSALSATPR